jgi:uncharacterized membrane protein YoaK (UPF0700 family)
MDLYDIILVGDIIVLVGGILLFLVGKLLGEPWNSRFALPATVLIIAALMVYVIAEVIIGKGANLAWGVLLIICFAVIMHFVNKRNEDAS